MRGIEGLFPAHPFPQTSDVAYVVTAVPGIQRGVLIESDGTMFGVMKGALPFDLGKRSQQGHPSQVQTFEQSQ